MKTFHHRTQRAMPAFSKATTSRCTSLKMMLTFGFFLLSMLCAKPAAAQAVEKYPPTDAKFDSTASQTIAFGTLLEPFWADDRYQVEVRFTGQSRIFTYRLRQEVGNQYLTELPYFNFDNETFEYRIAIRRCYFWCGYERTAWQTFSVVAESNRPSNQYTVKVDIEPNDSDVVFALQQSDPSGPIVLYGSTAPIAGVLAQGTYYFNFITPSSSTSTRPTSVTITVNGSLVYSGPLVNNYRLTVPPNSQPPPPPVPAPRPQPQPQPQPRPQPQPQPQPQPSPSSDPENLCVVDPNAYNICLDLNLGNSGSSTARSFFVSAKNQWEQIIVGDIPDVSVPPGSTLGLGRDAGPLLQAGQITNLDDLYIHAKVSFIDGPGRVLGQAAPLRGYSDPNSGFYYAKAGIMEFDSADLNTSFRSVILHEMAHVIGIGTLWTANGIYRDPTYLGKNANREYQQLVGDATATKTVPIEQDQGGRGTVDSHWDEGCLRNEIMTGFLSGGAQPISRITIGGLEDLGLEVDYSQASSFSSSQTNPTECRRNGGRRARSLRVRHLPQSSNYMRRQLGFEEESSSQTHHNRRRLSDEELKAAERFGMKAIFEHRKNMKGVQLPENVVDLGSHETEVLMLSSDGEIVAVHVVVDDDDPDHMDDV